MRDELDRESCQRHRSNDNETEKKKANRGTRLKDTQQHDHFKMMLKQMGTFSIKKKRGVAKI